MATDSIGILTDTLEAMGLHVCESWRSTSEDAYCVLVRTYKKHGELNFPHPAELRFPGVLFAYYGPGDRWGLERAIVEEVKKQLPPETLEELVRRGRKVKAADTHDDVARMSSRRPLHGRATVIVYDEADDLHRRTWIDDQTERTRAYAAIEGSVGQEPSGRALDHGDLWKFAVASSRRPMVVIDEEAPVRCPAFPFLSRDNERLRGFLRPRWRSRIRSWWAREKWKVAACAGLWWALAAYWMR